MLFLQETEPDTFFEKCYLSYDIHYLCDFFLF